MDANSSLASARRGCDHVLTVGDRTCCGVPSGRECRCQTDAEAIASALRAYVARRVRDPHDAADVTQDALLRMYRSVGRLEEEEALEGWMYRIAASAIVDHHRRTGTRAEPVDPADIADRGVAEPHPEPRPEEALATCLTPLLERVPERYRTALQLTDLGELTQEEAAERLGLSTSGMKSRVQRGRQMLRTEVTRCCRVELDARGALTDAALRDPTSGC